MITCSIDPSASKITVQGLTNELELVNLVRNWISSDKTFATINRTKSNQEDVRMSLLRVSKCKTIDDDKVSFDAEYDKAHGKEAIAHIIQKLKNKFSDKIIFKDVSISKETNIAPMPQLVNHAKQKPSDQNAKELETKATKNVSLLLSPLSNNLSRKRKKPLESPLYQQNGLSNGTKQDKLTNGKLHTNEKKYKLK